MTSHSLRSLAVLLLAGSFALGCRLLDDEKKKPASFDCSRIPVAEVEAVVGKLTRPPKDRDDKTTGGRCQYAFKDQYVDVLAPPSALFDEVAATKHAPATSIHDPAFRHADLSLTIDGVGDAAYLANANGVEYVLWAKRGSCVVAVQSSLDPALRMDDYKQLAALALARTSCK
jgi:hypothetical protein